MALRISSRERGDGVRATPKLSPKKLSLWHTLLRLEISKKLRLTEEQKPIRGRLLGRIVITLESKWSSHNFMLYFLLLVESAYEIRCFYGFGQKRDKNLELWG